MKLAGRIRNTEESRTVRFTNLIAQLRSEGRDIIDLAVGEPVFATPPEVVAATRAALEQGMTRYGPVAGLPALRARLAATFDGVAPEQVVVTNGSKQALYALFQVLLDPGDEVIIPSPCWVSFVQQVRLAGGVPKRVPTRRNQLDLAAIAAAVTEKTAAILVNSPNNPTGAVYPESDLKRLAEIVRDNDLVLISDEAYDTFVYDGDHASPFAFPDIRDRLVVVKSFSKSFSMTGFRVGYLVAPPTLAKAVAKLQGHASGNVCTFAQYGALGALDLPAELHETWRRTLRENRAQAFEWVKEHFDCEPPAGAFYLFPDVSGRLQQGETAEAFASRLLRETGVAVVPGEAFGADNHLRISYAVANDILTQGLARLEEAL